MTNQPEPKGDENITNSSGDSENDTEFLVGETKLSSVADDAFGHDAHVDTLEQIVAEVTRPWHIALYGTWGSGKSSIVHLLYRRIRGKQADGVQYPNIDSSGQNDAPEFHDTLCISFDAWKHAEDSLRTELLLDLNQSLQQELDRRFGPPNKTDAVDSETGSAEENDRLTLHSRDEGVLSSEKVINELYDVEEVSNTEINPLSEVIPKVDNLWLAGVMVAIIIALVYLGLELIGNPLPIDTGTFAVLNVILAAFIFLGGGEALISSFVDEIREARRDVDQKLANPQNDWSGAYENLFNAIVAAAATQYSERHPQKDAELQRIVVTIDDIDRCRSQTAIDTLIALKSFLSHEKCVYIVPCDEDALYEHLEAADQGRYLSDSVNQQNFLAKFFETELEIPTPSERHLSKYFDERQAQFDRSFDPRSLKVLQQADLDTPRRVTRALNRLVVLEELAHNRDVIRLDTAAQSDSGSTATTSPDNFNDVDRASTGSETWNPRRAFLAVISILQTDYPRLHAALERDPELLDELYEQLAGGFVADDRQGLDPLFESFGIPEERRDSLVRFLSQTRNIAQRIDSPGPYLRLTGNPPNPGDRFKTRFDRGRTEAARELIELQEQNLDTDDPEVTDTIAATLNEITKHITQKLSEETAQIDAFPTAVALAGALDIHRREKVAVATLNALGEGQPQELLSEMELSEFEPLLDALPTSRTQEFLKLYVRSVVDDEGLRADNFTSVMHGPGELFESDEVQDAFADTIHTARRRGQISDAKFADILSDIREKKPELYTPELVRWK